MTMSQEAEVCGPVKSTHEGKPTILDSWNMLTEQCRALLRSGRIQSQKEVHEYEHGQADRDVKRDFPKLSVEDMAMGYAKR